MPGRVPSPLASPARPAAPTAADPSAALGALLLRGWTMLAAACGDCNLPLMRDPATREEHCVGCRRVWPAAAADDAPQSPPQRTAPPAAAAGTNAASPSSDSSSSSTPSPAAARPARRPAAANGPISNRHAAAAGTAGAQRVVPVAEGDAVIHQAYREMRAARQQREQQELQQLQQQQGGTPAAAPAGAPPGRHPDTAQLLADRMLAGWALLGEHCPLCSSPLMRQRSSREVRCVVCDLPVQMEQRRSNGSAEDAADGDPSAATAAAAAPAPAPVAAPTATAARSGSAGVGERAAGGEGVARARADAAGLLGTAAAPPSPSQQAVLAALQAALLLKLDDVRHLLLSTPACDADQLRAQLELTQVLLRTLTAAGDAAQR